MVLITHASAIAIGVWDGDRRVGGVPHDARNVLERPRNPDLRR
jgi:hypothetical protein